MFCYGYGLNTASGDFIISHEDYDEDSVGNHHVDEIAEKSKHLNKNSLFSLIFIQFMVPFLFQTLYSYCYEPMTNNFYTL